MGEFLQMASRMTPGDHARVLQGIREMAPKAVGSEGRALQKVFEAAQKAPGGWVTSGSIVTCGVIYASYWVFSKGEWFWANQQIEKTNALVSKREMPENTLQRFEDARRDEMANMERIVKEFKECFGFMATEKKELLEEIQKMKESQEKVQALLGEKGEKLQRLVSALESAISRLSKIKEEQQEVDRSEQEIYHATVKIEKEFSEYLEGFKKLLPKESGETQ